MIKWIVIITIVFISSCAYAGDIDCSRCICKDACRAKQQQIIDEQRQTGDTVQRNPIVVETQPEAQTPDQPPPAPKPDYDGAPEPPPQVPTIEEWLCQTYGICD